jgi:hypothetical protein
MSKPLTAKELAQILDEIGDITERLRGQAKIQNERADNSSFKYEYLDGKLERLQTLNDRLYDLLDQEPVKPVSRASLLQERTLEDDG